jgi:glycosyltransferase involved in cell wall biosynthesis
MADLLDRPPIASAALSLVLPLSNVEAVLKDVAARWDALLKSLDRDYEILLVDDGSSDGSAALVDALAKELPRIRVLKHTKPCGIGAALRTGINAARQPLLVYAPCEPRYQPEDLKRLLECIDIRDIVSGCRGERPAPWLVRCVAFVYRCLVRVLFGVPLERRPGWLGWKSRLFHRGMLLCTGVRLNDINCPFKLFRREIFGRIPIQSDGPFVHAEILAKANYLSCIMGETGVAGPTDDDAPSLWRLVKEGYGVLRDAEFGPAEKPRSRKSENAAKK